MEANFAGRPIGIFYAKVIMSRSIMNRIANPDYYTRLQKLFNFLAILVGLLCPSI